MEDSELERHYQSLLNRLHQYSEWPSLYRFKFIISSEEMKKLQRIESWFDGRKAKIRHFRSSKNNYLSITVDVTMNDPEEVLGFYRKAQELEGVIAL